MSSLFLYQDGVPQLSVVLATWGDFSDIALTTGHLRAQTVREKIELVIVGPSLVTMKLPEGALNGFAAVRIVEVLTKQPLSVSNAMGVRASQAPLIAFAEDHAFPDVQWAQALIEAHQGPWSVVGPVVSNFNPNSVVSRADFLVGYGLWTEGAHNEGKEVRELPGHNSCYKREVLLDLGSELESSLHAETILHWELCVRGHRLWLEPRARLSHMNYSLWKSWAPVQFHHGRLFGAARAARWNPMRRALYALASPLIPAVRLRRLLIAAPQKNRLSTIAVLCLGLAIDAFGQMCGYLKGAGASAGQLNNMEFGRTRHVTRRDRRDARALQSALSARQPR